MSTSTAAHARLARFAGAWEGPETSPGGTTLGRFTSRVLDDRFLLHDYEQVQDGRVVFRGHGVYGVVPGTETCTMYWVDSATPAPVTAAGPWVGDVLTFQNQGDLGHHRYVYALHGDDRFSFRIERSTDGHAWATVMEGHYRRTA